MTEQPEQNPQTPPLRRVKSATESAGIYIRLIGIIQSLALGLFLSRLDAESIRSGNWIYILQCILILQVIVATWHEYVLGTIIYQWPLGIFDAYIPIAFGISQYYLITNLSTEPSYFPSFCWSLGLFAAVSLSAFLNQYFKSDKYEGNQDVIRHLESYRKQTLVMTFAFFGFFIAFASIAASSALTDIYFKRLGLGVLNACLIGHQGRSVFSRPLRTLFHERGLLL